MGMHVDSSAHTIDGMEPTDWLAVWGALLSTALAGLAAWRELRERPRLDVRLSWEVEWTSEEVTAGDGWGDDPTFEDVTLARLQLTVINEGSTPQVVVGAWLEFVPGTTRPSPSGAAIPFKPDEDFDVIPAHQAKRYTIERFALGPEVHVDTPIRAYVVDARNKAWWSEGKPLYRELVSSYWRPGRRGQLEISSDLTDALRETPVNRIEPRWKIWKPKHLRT